MSIAGFLKLVEGDDDDDDDDHGRLLPVAKGLVNGCTLDKEDLENNDDFQVVDEEEGVGVASGGTNATDNVEDDNEDDGGNNGEANEEDKEERRDDDDNEATFGTSAKDKEGDVSSCNNKDDADDLGVDVETPFM